MLIKLLDIVRQKLPSKLDRKLRPIWFFVQRFERGFDDSEICSLDSTIAKHALPRLKRYKSILTDKNGITNGAKGNITVEQWHYALDEIIWLFEQYDSGEFYSLNKLDSERASKASKLFGEHFMALWW